MHPRPDGARLTHHAHAGEDIYNAPNQAAPSPALVEALLARGTDASKGMAGARARARLCAADLARTMGRRRAECKAADPQFSLSLAQKLAGSSKCVLAFSSVSLSPPL